MDLTSHPRIGKEPSDEGRCEVGKRESERRTVAVTEITLYRIEAPGGVILCDTMPADSAAVFLERWNGKTYLPKARSIPVKFVATGDAT